jgi:hypothetical protein
MKFMLCRVGVAGDAVCTNNMRPCFFFMIIVIKSGKEEERNPYAVYQARHLLF